MRFLKILTLTVLKSQFNATLDKVPAFLQDDLEGGGLVWDDLRGTRTKLNVLSADNSCPTR